MGQNKRIGSGPALGRILTLSDLFCLFLLWLRDTKSSINFCLATKYLSLFFFFLHYLSLFLHSLYTTLRYDCYGTIEHLVLSIFYFFYIIFKCKRCSRFQYFGWRSGMPSSLALCFLEPCNKLRQKHGISI